MKLSLQEKAFKKSQIRRDDNIEIKEEESMTDCNSNDTNTLVDGMNN